MSSLDSSKTGQSDTETENSNKRGMRKQKVNTRETGIIWITVCLSLPYIFGQRLIEQPLHHNGV